MMTVGRTNRPFRRRTDTHRRLVLAVPVGLFWMRDVYQGAAAVVGRLSAEQGVAVVQDSSAPETIVQCLVPANQRSAFGSLRVLLA